jgi:hypothetical protein
MAARQKIDKKTVKRLQKKVRAIAQTAKKLDSSIQKLERALLKGNYRIL